MLEIRRHLDGFLVAVSSDDRISALERDKSFEKTVEYHKKVDGKIVLCGVEFFYKNTSVFQLKDARKAVYMVLDKYSVRIGRGRPGDKDAA